MTKQWALVWWPCPCPILDYTTLFPWFAWLFRCFRRPILVACGRLNQRDTQPTTQPTKCRRGCFATGLARTTGPLPSRPDYGHGLDAGGRHAFHAVSAGCRLAGGLFGVAAAGAEPLDYGGQAQPRVLPGPGNDARHHHAVLRGKGGPQRHLFQPAISLQIGACDHGLGLHEHALVLVFSTSRAPSCLPRSLWNPARRPQAGQCTRRFRPCRRSLLARAWERRFGS